MMTSEKKIVAWYLNVRWSEKVNNEWEEEIHDIPVELMRKIDTFLDGIEEEYNKSQEDFTEEESQGKVYDPPMSETDQYLLNKEREEEHKSYDY
jgi:hypothetical protein